MTAQQKQAKAIKLYGDLLETLKRPSKYGIQDMMEWFEQHGDEFGYLLDDVFTELDPTYPDQQRMLDAELDQAAGEVRVSA